MNIQAVTFAMVALFMGMEVVGFANNHPKPPKLTDAQKAELSACLQSHGTTLPEPPKEGQDPHAGWTDAQKEWMPKCRPKGMGESKHP